MKQQILEKIKSIVSAIGLSGYYSSLPESLKNDEDIVKAFKERRKQL